MPKRGLGEEELEAGRIAGLIKRTDPDLFTQLKEQAEERGMKVSDYIIDVVKSGMGYGMYKDIDGATILKVMDILDRLQKYMLQWMTNTVSNQLMDNALATTEVMAKLTEIFAPVAGYVKQEEMQKLLEKVREEAKKEVMEKMQRRGIVSDAVDKLVDKTVEKITEEAIRKLDESGVLDDLAEIIARETEGTTKAVGGVEE